MDRATGPFWKRALLAMIALAALTGAAAYGFLIHRHHVFPYHVVWPLWERVQWPAAHHFHRIKPGLDHDVLSAGEVERLAALPYLRGYRPAGGRSSVLFHDPSRAFEGLNFYVSGDAPVATLMDMNGATLRTWTADAGKALPGALAPGVRAGGSHFFRSAEPLGDGGLVVMFEDFGLARLTSSSQVQWAWKGSVHHELFVDGDGSIWTFTRSRRSVPALDPDEPLIEDFIVELSPQGRLVRQISVLESLRRSSYAPLLARVPHAVDLLHANSLQVLDGSLAARSSIFRKGNVLISLRNIDLIAILDPEQGRIVWALSGPWHHQHSAQLLSSGHLLLFDNLGSLRPASRILELDPLTQEVTWTYGAATGEEFFSQTNGFVRRLENGNTLVCETNAGRSFEVTPDRRIAWDFVNPKRAGKNNELIANIYELRRLPSRDFGIDEANRAKTSPTTGGETR